MVRRIGAVIVAVDGFNGERILNQSLLIRSENGKTPVRKPDGYYVFWDDGGLELRVEIESVWYEKVFLTLSISRLKEKSNPIYFVYLIPSKAYPYPAECEWEYGSASPKSVIWAALEDTKRLFGIVDIKEMIPSGNSVIYIKNPYRILLEDRLLYISDGEKGVFCKAGEVRKKETEVEEVFLLQPLSQQFQKEKMKIWLVFRTRADGEGNVKIPGSYRMKTQEEETWDFAYAAER